MRRKKPVVNMEKGPKIVSCVEKADYMNPSRKVSRTKSEKEAETRCCTETESPKAEEDAHETRMNRLEAFINWFKTR